jgi:hypothetical protein
MKLLILLFLFSLLNFKILAQEKADAFIVRAFESHYKILSPTILKKQNSVLIYNHTLSNIVGKLTNSRNDKIQYVTIAVGKYKSIDIKILKGDEYYFIPVSPPFQKVILKTGVKAYEIPPRKQSK